MSQIDPAADPEASHRQVLADEYENAKRDLARAQGFGDADLVKKAEAAVAAAQKALAAAFKE